MAVEGVSRTDRPGAPLVRRASAGDLDALVDVVWSVAAEGRWLGTEIPFDRAARRARYDELLARADAAIFVAEDRGHGAGAVVGELTVELAPFGVAGIAMAVLPPWRGRGVGRRLLDGAVAWARDAGAHKCALEVWPHNEPAIALYRSVGFVEEGRKRRHYRRANGELWDALLMGLALE